MENNRIRQLLETVFEEESVQAAAGRPFTELECWDSMRYVQWVVAVQSAFAIELDRAQIQKIISLEGLREVLKEHCILS